MLTSTFGKIFKTLRTYDSTKKKLQFEEIVLSCTIILIFITLSVGQRNLKNTDVSGCTLHVLCVCCNKESKYYFNIVNRKLVTRVW